MDIKVLDGNSEAGAHVRSKLCYLFKASDQIESSRTGRTLSSSKLPFYLHTCATFSGLPSNISTTHGKMDEVTE